MKKSELKTFINALIVISILFANTLFVLPVSAANFNDISSEHWAYKYISALSNAHIINGNEDGTFKADDTITRGQLAKILVGCSGIEAKFRSTSSYKDVGLNEWYSPYIEALLWDIPSYVTKDGNKVFYPNSPATREQIAYSIVSTKKLFDEKVDIDKISSGYSDFNTINQYYKKYVAIAIDKGYLKGYEDGTFKPKNGVSRAEACTILYRAFSDKIDKKISTFYSSDSKDNVINAGINVVVKAKNQYEVYITAEDITTSSVLWEKKIGVIDTLTYGNIPNQSFSSKVLENNGVVYAVANNILYGFVKSTGEQVVKVSNVGSADPIMDKDTIYCTSNGAGFSDGPFILTFNIDGSLKWGHYDLSDEGLFLYTNKHGITEITQDEIYVRCYNKELLEAYAVFDKNGRLLRTQDTVVRDSEPRDRYGNIIHVSDTVTKGAIFHGKVEKIDGHKILVTWHDVRKISGEEYTDNEKGKLLSFYGITLGSSKWEEDKDLVVTSLGY